MEGEDAFIRGDLLAEEDNLGIESGAVFPFEALDANKSKSFSCCFLIARGAVGVGGDT